MKQPLVEQTLEAGRLYLQEEGEDNRLSSDSVDSRDQGNTQLLPSVFFELCYSLSYLKVPVIYDCFPNHQVIGNDCKAPLNEPPGYKTNNVVSDQVRHKSTCTVTEAG